MGSRDRQRANRRLKNCLERGERISKRSLGGYKDLTAYNAIQRIRTNGQAQIVLN